VRWYHEAWVSDQEIVEHWGEVGTEGDVKHHLVTPEAPEQDQLHAVLHAASDALVADFAVAKRAIETALRSTSFADFARICDEDGD
jgi:hypothetical protein